MGKTTTVTFTKPIDHYAPGDVREVSADELKRLEDYAKRWKITDYYVEGKQVLDAPENPRPSKAKTTVSSDGTKKRNKQAAPKVEETATDEESDQGEDTTPPDAPDTTDQGDESGEPETDEATELPEVTDEPATDDTKKNAKK